MRLQNGWTESRISSADLDQMKGVGCSLGKLILRVADEPHRAGLREKIESRLLRQRQEITDSITTRPVRALRAPTDGVVPVTMKRLAPELNAVKLSGGDFTTARIASLVEFTPDT